MIGGIDNSTKKLNVQNCINNGDVKIINNGLKNNYSGGIIGNIEDIEGEIRNCVNNGNVTSGKQQAGGIVGENFLMNIYNCINNGTIIAEQDAAGGIVAYHRKNAIIQNCINNGYVEAIQQVGGIVGGQKLGNVNNCYNTGEIVSNGPPGAGISGGIVGLLSGGTISNVYNIGKIVTNDIIPNKFDRAGGIVGLQKAGTIEKAYNKGEVLGTVLDTNDEEEILGGIVAVKTGGTISKTYYYGNLTSLIGSTSSSEIIGTVTENQAGVVEKVTDDIASYEDFLNWIKNK